MRTSYIVRDERTRQAFVADVLAAPLDKPLEFWVEPYSDLHSPRQRRTYWWRINQIVKARARDSGEHKDELHEAMKSLYCPVREKVVDGMHFYVKSTKGLSKEEWARMFEDVARHAAEHWGIVCDDPIPAHVRHGPDA